ncbi:hypothetical protein OQA88_4180 [Cercophora sp. LCS_1]
MKYSADRKLKLSPAAQAIRQAIQDEPRYDGLRQFVYGQVKFEKIGGQDDKPNDILKGVCTTPQVSGDAEYLHFKHHVARSVVLDEAGAMTQQDALLVRGPGLRPTVLAGDEKQLPPTVMSHNKSLPSSGNVVDAFGAIARSSVLEHFKRTGFPCLLLSIYHRVIRGGFDLALDIIYPEFKEGFEYGETTKLDNHPLATKSNLAVLFVDKILHGSIGVKPEDIAIITPYKENLEELRRILGEERDGAYPGRKDDNVNTTDSFQGQEDLVVIFVLVFNETAGPQFVADSHRLCVGDTRHKYALFVVGDIQTKPKEGTDYSQELGDGGEAISSRMSRSDAFWGTLCEKGLLL